MLVSGAASNRGGAIRTANVAGTTGAGAITLSAASFDNTTGTINAATALTLGTAGALTNAAGGLVQASGGLLALDAGSTDNRKGAIVGAADLRAATGALDNTGGRIEAAADLQLDTRGGALLNNADATQAARIQAGGSARVSAGEATNLSQGSNGATITGQRLTLTAISVANTGTLAASSAGGALAIAAIGALTNTGSGLIAAFGGNADLRSGTLTNRGGGTVYAQGGLSLMTTGALDNTAGQLLTDGALNATSTAFDNRAGLVQASSIGMKTSGGMLNNGTGGRVASSGDTTLAIGALSNVGGSVVSGRTLAVTASGTVDNSAGLLSGAQGLNLDATSQRVANAGGTIKSAQGDVGVHADVLQTDNGSIAAAGTTSLQATTGIGNHGGAITGHDLSITTGTLDNTAGRIASDRDTTISSASTDNTDGEISAKRDLVLSATTLVNTRGQIVADNALTINTASRSLAGNVTGNDVTLTVQGDYGNSGTLSARHDLTVNAHNIDNSGVLSAGNLLSANAQGHLINASGGEISGASVALTATGSLVNAGLINATGSPAVDTGRASIQSASAANTGRLYGESIDVAAAQIANTGTGVIAARSSLTLAGDDIRNTGPDALLLSLGDMRLVGSVTGTIGSVTNTAGRIEAGGDLTISAGTILNANGGVQTALALIGSSALTTYVVPNGSATQYPLSQCRGISERWDQAFCILHPEIYGQRSGLAAVWDSVPGGPSTGDGGTSFVTTPHYAWNDPVYRQLNVAGPSTPRPAEPGGAGACTPTDSGGEGGGSRIPGPQCDPWRAAAAAWDNDYQPIGNQLQAAIDTYNASVAADNATVNFEDYTLLKVTETTRQSQVTASAPGKMLSGRLLLLNGTNITNTDSQMVAGGLLYVNGVSGAAGAGGVNNIATPGQQVITYSGTATFTHLDSSCNFFGSCNHVRNDDPAQPYNPTPSPTPFDLPTVVFRQNASLTQSGTAQGGASAVSGTTAGGAGSVGVSAIGNVIRPGTAPDDAVNAHAATSALRAAGSVSADTVTGDSAIGATRSGTTSQATLAALTGIDGSGATAIVAPARSAIGVTTVQRFTVNASDQKARDVILTVVPRLTPPANQLFQIHAEPGAKYLVETDPAFTNRQTFLSSDYFQQQLQLDPERSLKRYGDGFEEQRLVDDQILALTGRRFLSGYASTQDEYQALMNAGVAFARAYQLSPGVALSAEQMARLTTDIVWLSTEPVTLADGSSAQVLVPQVYLHQPQGNDLAPSGALMAGSSIVVKTAGQLVNSASLQGDSIDASAADIGNSGLIAANRDLVLHASNDLANLGGQIVSTGGSISLTAGRDLLLQTRTLDTRLTTTTAQGTSTSTSTSSRTAIDRIATVQAGGDLLLSAGRDLGVQGASVTAAGDLSATAGRDLTVSAVQGRYQIDVQTIGGANTQGRTGYISQASTTSQASNLSAANITLTAGTDASQATADATTSHGNLSITGSDLSASRNISLQGNNVSIEAAKSSQSADIQTVQRRAYNRGAQSDETLVGGNVSAGANLSVTATGGGIAGQGDITLQGARLVAGGQASLIANNNLNVLDATTAHTSANESYRRDKGLIKSTDSTASSQTTETRSTGSSISAGGTHRPGSGHRPGHSRCGNVAGDQGVLLSAGRNLIATESRSTTDRASSQDIHQSGLASSFMGVPLPGTASDKTSGTNHTEAVNPTRISSSAGAVRIVSNGSTALQGVQVKAAQGISVQGGEVITAGAVGVANSTSEHATHGTNIGMTGWHDLGKGIDAHAKNTATDQTTSSSSARPGTRLEALRRRLRKEASGDMLLQHAEQKLPGLRILDRFDGPPARTLSRSFTHAQQTPRPHRPVRLRAVPRNDDLRRQHRHLGPDRRPAAGRCRTPGRPGDRRRHQLHRHRRCVLGRRLGADHRPGAEEPEDPARERDRRDQGLR